MMRSNGFVRFLFSYLFLPQAPSGDPVAQIYFRSYSRVSEWLMGESWQVRGSSCFVYLETCPQICISLV